MVRVPYFEGYKLGYTHLAETLRVWNIWITLELFAFGSDFRRRRVSAK